MRYGHFTRLTINENILYRIIKTFPTDKTYLNAEDVKMFSGAGMVSVWKNGLEDEAVAGSIICTLGSTSSGEEVVA